MVTAILQVVLAAAVWVPQDEPDESQRLLNWQEDLAYLAEEFPKRHKDPFTILSEADFREQVETLEVLLPGLSDEELLVEFMALVASVGDSHSAVRTRLLSDGPYLPLFFRWFPGGYHVVAVRGEDAEWLGARLVGIDGRSMEELVERLREIQCFGNVWWERHQLPQLLRVPGLLAAAGLLDDTAELAVELRRESGEVETLVIPTARRLQGNELQWMSEQRATRQRGGDWHHWSVEEGGLLYVQYNRCASSPEHDLNQFGLEVLEAIEANPELRAFVVDVQYNSGGSSVLGTMLFGKLIAALPASVRKNGLFCIIGRRTFSSAVLNALELQDAFGARLIGEPSGGGANHFGEVRQFSLPHSGVVVSYSTKYFQKVAGEGLNIEPDERILPDPAAWFGAEDPFLDAVPS